MDPSMPVGASSVQLMVRFGAERGVPDSDLLVGSGILPEVLADPLAEVTVAQEYGVLRNLVRHFGSEPGLGVVLGQRYTLAMHGVGALMMLTAETLRESFEFALPLSDLSWAFTEVAMTEEDGLAIITVDSARLPADVRPFKVEGIAAALKMFHRGLLGEDRPFVAVHFTHSAPSDVGAYTNLFGVEPTFGAADDSVRFDVAHLDRPLPQGNEWVRRGYEQVCRDLLAKRHAATGIAGAVRGHLVERPGEFPDATEVAARLAISPRTLFRRLDDEGTSFRLLADEVRETIAQELLATPGMTTGQAARRLGYSESASFVRAFKRWKGITPQQFRVTAGSR